MPVTPGRSPDIYVVSLVVRDPAGRLLVVRKRGTARFMQPGGKPEPGEDLREAACRELAEEVGLVVLAHELRPLGRFRAPAANEPGLVIETDCYAAPLPGTPRPLAEIEELDWLETADPPSLWGRPVAPLLTESVVPLLALDGPGAADTAVVRPAVVRRAAVSDASTVAAMLWRFNTEFDSPTPSAGQLGERFTALLGRDDVLVALAETRDGPAGFALVTLRPTPYCDGPLAQLEELYVVPGMRGRGTGGLIMAWLEHHLGLRRAFELHANVDEIDRDARRFYDTHGFVNVETDGSRMLCYVREL